MKIIMLAVVVFFFTYSVTAQMEKWVVKAGQTINDALPATAKFHYAQFTNGTVHFRDETQSDALLNFNLLTGEMQFTNAKGDTLAVDNEATIRYITINSDSFFYDKVYLQLITANSIAKLAKKEELKIGDIKKVGAYDQPSSVSAITNITSLNSQGQMRNLTTNKEMAIIKETSYYFGNTYNHFLPANKRNLLKLFGKNENEIELFLKERNLNFSKEEDLKEMISFLNN